MAAARRLGGDVRPALAAFLGDANFRATESHRSDRSSVVELLQALRGRLPMVAVAPRVGVDRTTMARWLHGRTEPLLPELLAFVDVTTHRLADFVAVFVDPARVPSVREAFRILQRQRDLAFEHPFSHAVLRALELDVYCALRRHRPGVIARALGISMATEAECLQQLAVARLVHRLGGRWVPLNVLLVDTRTSPAKNAALKAFWAEEALKRLRAQPESASAGRNLFSYNLFAISHEGFEEIRQVHIDYYERVRTIVAASAKADRVVLLNQQVLDLS